MSEMSESVFTQYGYYFGLGHSIWGYPDPGNLSIRLSFSTEHLAIRSQV